VRIHEHGRDTFESGTAFFISETVLLTAGHLLRHPCTKTIVVQLPGTTPAELYVDDLFTARSDTIECKVLGNGYPDVDLCVLQVLGDYRANQYLDLMRTDLSKGTPLDVVGYPGDYNDRYIKKMHSGRIEGRQGVQEVGDLFPKCELIVSHGSADTGGHHPRYLLSTVIGMSGSPVLIDGRAMGTNITEP
jgi:hypothetical protein